MSIRERKGQIILEGEASNFKDIIDYYEGVNLVGRNPAKTTLTIKDKSISQVHAKIISNGSIIKVVDAKSKNGVYLNSMENQIPQQVEVQIDPSKDIIYFAQIKAKIIPDRVEEKKIVKKVQNLEAKNIQFNQVQPKSVNSIKKESLQKQKETKERNIADTKQTDENDEKLTKKTGNSKNNEKDQSNKSININIDKKEKKKETKKKIGKKQSKEKEKQMQEETKIELLQKKTKTVEETSTEPIRQIVPVKKSSKEKKSESNETKVKGSQKPRTKSLGKQEESMKAKDKGLFNRKKMPDLSDQITGVQSRRSLLHKTILLSGHKIGFKPTIRITLTQNWRDSFDVLVMQKYSRTFKLLYSLCLGIPVVNLQWVIESEYRRGFVPYDRFYLQAPQKDLILKAITKAKCQVKVFNGLKFHLVNQDVIHLPVDQLTALIQAGGGQLIKKIDKKKTDILKNVIFLFPLKYTHQDVASYVHFEGVKKFTVEMLLDSCLYQQIKWQQNIITL